VIWITAKIYFVVASLTFPSSSTTFQAIYIYIYIDKHTGKNISSFTEFFFFQSAAQLQYVEDSEPVTRSGNEVNVTIGEQCKNRAASAGRNG